MNPTDLIAIRDQEHVRRSEIRQRSARKFGNQMVAVRVDHDTGYRALGVHMANATLDRQARRSSRTPFPFGRMLLITATLLLGVGTMVVWWLDRAP